MPSAIAIEQGFVLGNSGQATLEPEGTPNLLYPIGDNRNSAELEFWHIQETLAKQDSLEMIAKRAWSQEGNLLDLLQTGIIGLVAWEHSPLVLAGEALHLGLAKLKTLERGISLDDALEMPISETSPDLFKGLSWLLTAATVASVLPVPANLLVKGKAGQPSSISEKSGSSAGGQGPEFKIPGWVWTAAGGIGLLGLITACARAFGLPEPAVKVATNTPDVGPSLTPTERPSATHTATLAATPTETPFFGAGGPELPGGAPDQIRSLLETGINLPTTVCVASPETGGNRDQWDNWIKTLVENRANQTAIDELKATITAKLESQGTSFSTRTLELCSGGGGGWSFAIRDKSSGKFWWSYDLENNRFADRPDQVFDDRDWNFRPMSTNGLKSGLEVEIMMVNGWPLAVAVNSDGQPVQYFDPVLGEFINFYPDPDTATPASSNTPRPTEIPATAVPKPSPTVSPEPSPTAQPEVFASTLGVLPTQDELVGCATGVNLTPAEDDFVSNLNGLPYHFYRNRVSTNNGGVLIFEDGRVEDIRQFPVTRILQILVDGSNRPIPTNFENDYSVNDFAQLIKSGDFVGLQWRDGQTHVVALYCNAK